MFFKSAKILLPCILLAVGIYAVVAARDSEPFDPSTVAGVTEPPRIANGDEIKVSVRQIGPKHIRIDVYNESADYVYLPYLPGPEGDRAEYAIRRIEQWDKTTGKFVSSGDGHYSPGLNPLAPGASYNYDAYVNESGKYRVSMRILVDKPLRDRILKSHLADKDHIQMEMNAIERDLELAAGNFTTPVFSL